MIPPEYTSGPHTNGDADAYTTKASSISARVTGKAFDLSGDSRPVLRDIVLELDARSSTALMGPSGCGKTTLLRIIAGLDTDYDGLVAVNDEPIAGPSRDRTMIFQDARLLPWYSAYRNVAFALPKGLNRKQVDRRVGDALREVGLTEFAKAWPGQLSGGMTKRVALARAIVNNPSLMLLDEPFVGVDEPKRRELQDLILRLRARLADMTMVLVTHSVPEAVLLCDRIVILGNTPATVVRQIDIDPGINRTDHTSSAFNEACHEVLDMLNNAADLSEAGHKQRARGAGRP